MADLHKLKNITKPFWVPAITGIYLLMPGTPDRLVLGALVFGYIGDLLLMRGKKSWFITGAVSFLIGHLFYITVFMIDAGSLDVFTAHPLQSSIFLLPYAGYTLFLRRILYKNVRSVFTAAALYLIVLLLMSYASLLRIWNVPAVSAAMTFCGTLLFIVSDTLIAVRRFRRDIKGIGTLIIFTYIAAQLLIVCGLSQS